MQAYNSNAVWMHVALIEIDIVYYLRNFKKRFDKHIWVFAVYSSTPAHFVSFSRFFDNLKMRCQWRELALEQMFSNVFYN